MKKRVLPILLLLLLLCGCGRREEVPVVLSAPPTIADSETLPVNRTVRVAITEMLADSALPALLRTMFERETPYRLEFAPGTNDTVISVGRSGKADVLLVQQGTAVSQFVSAGYGAQETPLLSTSLLLLGPAEDPAQVGSAQTAQQAMIRIAQCEDAVFVSRYDDSDLYRAEMRLWADAGVVIGNGRTWYTAARLGMGGTLRTAEEQGAYTLADRETFLSADTSLHILMQDDPALRQTFAVVPVCAEGFDTVNAEGARVFCDWLMQSDTQTVLKNYGTEQFGCSIFNLQ